MYILWVSLVLSFEANKLLHSSQLPPSLANKKSTRLVSTYPWFLRSLWALAKVTSPALLIRSFRSYKVHKKQFSTNENKRLKKNGVGIDFLQGQRWQVTQPISDKNGTIKGLKIEGMSQLKHLPSPGLSLFERLLEEK